MRGRNEAQIVFMANELCDFGENGGKILVGFREVDAASIGFRNGFQFFVGLGKAFSGYLRLVRRRCALFGMFFFGRLCDAQFAAKRDGQHADVGRPKAGKKVLPGSGRRSIEPRRKQDEGFLSRNVGEPIESGGEAGGQIQLTKSEIETQLVQCGSSGAFVWGVFQYEFWGFVVAGNGDAVAGRETIEEGMDRLKMAALYEIHGWTSFDEEQNLGGFVHGQEICDGLLDAVVEQVEVLAVKTANELATSVGDDHADANAVHADSYVGS